MSAVRYSESRLQAYWAAVIRDLDVTIRNFRNSKRPDAQAYWATVSKDLSESDHPGADLDVKCIQRISYLQVVACNSSPVRRGYDLLYPPIESKEEFLSLLDGCNDESHDEAPLIEPKRRPVLKIRWK